MSGTTSPSITLKRQGAKGRYVALVDGIDEPAELTFSIVNDHLIIADHTGVPDVMRGMGVGKALVEHLVADAREKQIRIVRVFPCNGNTLNDPDRNKQERSRQADLFIGRVALFV